jgi:hypothetical protein
MKRVGIINGIARMHKYNAILGEKYKNIGFEAVTQYQFNPALLFCCHAHKLLHPKIKDIITNSDVVHCQSSSFFPVLSYFTEFNIKKPLILESPVLKSSTGTLLSSINLSKSYDVPDNKFIQFFLDTICFTPSWTENTLINLEKSGKDKKVFVVGSLEDSVSDIRGYHHMFQKLFDKGKHARIFYDNDFKVIEQYLNDYNKKIIN